MVVSSRVGMLVTEEPSAFVMSCCIVRSVADTFVRSVADTLYVRESGGHSGCRPRQETGTLP